MIVLGLLLLLATGALALGVVLENTQSTTIEAFGWSMSDLSLGTVFAAGVLTGLLFMLGVSMLLAGMSRNRENRLAARRVGDATSENERLQRENEELRAQLDDQPLDPYVDDPYGTDTVPTGTYTDEYDETYEREYNDDGTVIESETQTTRTRPATTRRRAKH